MSSAFSPAAAPAAPTPPLAHLMPGWFAIVMGWSGLALAWHRAGPLLGEAAGFVSIAAGAFAAVVFVGLLAFSLLRHARHPHALAEDLAHPIRHAFVAAIPISVILLATWLLANFGPATPGLAALWWLGALGQFLTTLWVLGRWLKPSPGGLSWASVTPVLIIPVVGNVLVPLAGLPLGHMQWSIAQFALGLFFWPVVVVLFYARLAAQGPVPDRLLPTMFIHVAPPAVIGLVALQVEAHPALAWMAWGLALFLVLWAGTLSRRIAALPFAVPHWGMSFPLAAFAVLTLRLSALPDGGWLRTPAVALLALVTLVILWLSLGTLRGLRAGTLLVPEPKPPAPAPAKP